MPATLTAVALVAALAATLPSLLAYNPPPSPTLLNQALALACWGLFAAVAAGAWRAGRGAWPLLLVLGGVALGVLGSWGLGALPTSLALAPLGLLAAAAVMVAAGASARATASAPALFAAFCWGWVVAGGLNLLIAGVQVFAPDWPDGTWLALSGLPGRAVGNLRQPNHLSSLLMGSALAVVALRQMAQGQTELGLPSLRPALSTPLFAALMAALFAALFAALMAGVVLTASRTGLVSVLLNRLHGLLVKALGGHTNAGSDFQTHAIHLNVN